MRGSRTATPGRSSVGALPPRTPRRETRPKRGVLGGNGAARGLSSVARSCSPSRAQTRSGALPRVPNRRDVRGARGSTGVRKYAPLQSTLTGKTEPVGRRRRTAPAKKRREMIVGCPPERTPRVRGVPRLTRRRWARSGGVLVLFDCSRKIRPSEY